MAGRSKKKQGRQSLPKTPRPVPEPKPTSNDGIWRWILVALVAALVGVQTYWTLTSAHQIRMEELAESVRNVYWLEYGRIYDGISSNVGWYATQMLTYRLFGFEIYAAKGLRLALHAASLICAALLLRRWVGSAAAVPVLFALGLSPTLLHFNTMQTSYGTDLQFAPICLYLLLSVRFLPRPADLARAGVGWALCCWACMSYPAFLFYMPALVVMHLWRWRGAAGRLVRGYRAWHLAAGVVGLLLPLALTLALVEQPGTLIHDPLTGAGLFRGGGKLTADTGLIMGALGATLRDLLWQGDSYYFGLPRPDFSGPLGWASFLLCLGAGALALRRGSSTRRGVILVLSVLLLSLLLPAFTSKGYPGLRRCTGVLAALYILYALAWRLALAASSKVAWRRLVPLALLLLLPLHHLASAPANLEHLAAPDPMREEMWFTLAGEPAASLDKLLDATRSGRMPLKCLDNQGRPLNCRYGEIFAALDGYRLWNGLPRPPVRAYDWRTGEDISLHLDLWATGHFPR